MSFDRAVRLDISDIIDLRCEIDRWLKPCGSCDAGMTTACTCLREDVRPLLLLIYNTLGDPRDSA